jgi:hypothetical protein
VTVSFVKIDVFEEDEVGDDTVSGVATALAAAGVCVLDDDDDEDDLVLDRGRSVERRLPTDAAVVSVATVVVLVVAVIFSSLFFVDCFDFLFGLAFAVLGSNSSFITGNFSSVPERARRGCRS